MNGSSARSDPQKTEEAVDHRQNNYVKLRQWGPHMGDEVSLVHLHNGWMKKGLIYV